MNIVDHDILVNKLLIYQIVVIVKLTDDIKNNMDYLLLEMVQSFFKACKYIALGISDFNQYINTIEGNINYNELIFGYVNKHAQISICGNNVRCYLKNKIEPNVDYCASIVELSFKEERSIHFSSIIFNNFFFVKKSAVKLFSFCPATKLVAQIQFYFKNDAIVEFNLYQSDSFLRTHEKSNFTFRLDENKQLFDADIHLERLSFFTKFTIKKNKN